MSAIRRVLRVLSLSAALAAPASAQDRVTEIVNPYPPGGATDIMGRTLMEGMAAHLGQRFIFVNRPGANGAIGTAAIARAAPDGHALLFTAAVSMVVNPLTQANPGYTLKSFDHLCQTFKNEMVIVAHPQSPLKSVVDLVKAAKEKPGALNYGILGIGSIPHLAMVELSQAAKVQFNAIPFKGDSDVLQQVHGGHVEFGAAVLASAARSGLTILGIFSQQRNPSIPDVPTVREAGYDVAPFSIGGLSAPAGLPAETRTKLEAACKAAAASENYVKVMKTIHQPADYYESGADYTKALEQDLVDKRRLLGQLGMVK